MAQDLDLLGDPIPENWGGRGRPAHVPTNENRNKVMLLLALGWGEDRVAASLGITRPTLKKHYFRELKVREEARARLEARLLAGMAAKALDGDVPAYREVRRALDKADLAEAERAYQAEPAPPAARAKIGVKAERQAKADALEPGKFSPGAAPARLLRH